ncbi:RNA polymerase II C-terminal domain phosphatase-like 4 [Ziziphus jujuba]|uniref:protein-serine/threonine phosphatase n=1 Tax=Ziziphus jujuba TaxID=326968 RepID=A0A6P6G8Y8_ZIZJJ|nr:RNA polymerase II C-terminal domain phosphatase-like 4 [Ziziphus jujuba]
MLKFTQKNFDMIIKLRPFVRTFLKEASKMYILHVYTLANRSYASLVVNILDPRREYIKGRVISRNDVAQKNRKTLDVIPAPESAILILDDTKEVWRKHERNLIPIEKYHFFSSSCQDFDPDCKSHSEMKSDESETEGALATILKVLEKIHLMFFDDESNGDKLILRRVSETIRKNILKGCKLLFPTNFMTDQETNHRLSEVAMRLGATCSTEYGPSVTHVVAWDFGTRGSRWAVKENKYLVHPDWLKAAYFTWHKHPEENFPVTQLGQLQEYLPYLIEEMFALCVFREVYKLFSQNYGFDKKMKRT